MDNDKQRQIHWGITKVGVSRTTCPHFAIVGRICKGGVKTQRWGANAKTEVGSNRKTEGGV